MMGGKYYINGKLEMLLCWRMPKKAVAAGNGSPYMATEISSDFVESCTHMHYVEGVYYNKIAMA